MRARIAVAVAALGAGAACLLLGLAVLAQPPALDASRAALAAGAAPAGGGGGVAPHVLGTGGDWRAVSAAAAFRRGPTPAAGRLLAPLAAAGPGDLRSWAGTLLAAVELARAQHAGQAEARRDVQEATSSLRQAVAADGSNEDAKRDLELLLTLQSKGRSGKSQARHRSSGGSRPHAKRAVHATAGSAPVGSGW